MWLILFLPPLPKLSHQVGRKKAKKLQTLKLVSEKALVISALQEVSLAPGIDAQTGMELTCVTTVCVCVLENTWTALGSGQQRAM